MIWIKRLVVAAVLVGIVALIVWSLLPRPVPVEAAQVTRGSLEVTVDEDGRARVRDRHAITAPLAGNLERIALRAGDPVEPGQEVARIAPVAAPLLDPRSRTELEGRVTVARAQRRQAEAAVARARAAAAFADNELARTRRLADQGAAPRVELEQRQLQAETARRELEAAQVVARMAASEVQIAEALTRRDGGGARDAVPVRSPVGGRVLRVVAESEGVVAPATPLLEVGDPTRLEVVVDVLTSEAVAIEDGAEVRLEHWGGPPLRACVRRVEPSAVTRVSALGVEEQRVLVVIDLLDPAPPGLGDGWRVEARIVTWRGDDVVQVPLGALFRTGDRWAVYAIEDRRARRRLVEIGARSTGAAQVLRGLAVGDRVIVHPGERVDDGVRVEAR